MMSNDDIDDIDNELFHAARQIMGDMPPPVRAAFESSMERIRDALGESPEAWRGAVIVLLNIMDMCTSGDEFEELIGEAALAVSRLRLITLTCSVLSTTEPGRTAFRLLGDEQ